MSESSRHAPGQHEGNKEDFPQSNTTKQYNKQDGEDVDITASSTAAVMGATDQISESLHKLTVDEGHQGPEHGQEPAAPTQPIGVLITNLPFRIRWQDLKDLCRKAAPILRAEVALEADGRSRGFGEVFVANAADASKIHQMLDGYDWQGRRIRVTIADPTQASPVVVGSRTGPLPLTQQGFVPPMGMAVPTHEIDQRSVFVGNLPWNIQWQDLKDLLRPAGRILRADVSIAPDGRSRGWGTALFATEQEAQAAIDKFHNTEVSGRRIRLRKDRLGARNAPGLEVPAVPRMPPPPPFGPLPGQ